MAMQHPTPIHSDGGPSSQARPHRLMWWSLLVALAFVAGTGVAVRIWPVVVDSTVGSRGETTVAPDEPGLPGSAVPIMDSPHIPVGQADAVHYNSMPPTSGPHFAVPPATGIYETPMSEGLQVHALEHGHVGIQYAPDMPDPVVMALRRIGARYPDDVFVAPYTPLSHSVALTAWGRIDTLDDVDEVRIVRFVEALRGRYDHGWTTHQHSGS